MAAFKDLLNKQKEHSKVRNIKYDDFVIQPYLTSELFQPKIAKIVTAIRSKCVRGIKENFPKQYKYNMKCPLQSDTEDTQEHILVCDKLGKSSNLSLVLVFEDTVQQNQIGVQYNERMNKRLSLIDNIEDPTPSPPGALILDLSHQQQHPQQLRTALHPSV